MWWRRASAAAGTIYCACCRSVAASQVLERAEAHSVPDADGLARVGMPVSEHGPLDEPPQGLGVPHGEQPRHLVGLETRPVGEAVAGVGLDVEGQGPERFEPFGRLVE